MRIFMDILNSATSEKFRSHEIEAFLIWCTYQDDLYKYDTQKRATTDRTMAFELWAENTDWIPDQRNPQRELHEISQTTPGSAEDVPEDEQKIECIEQARESSERK